MDPTSGVGKAVTIIRLLTYILAIYPMKII